MPQFKNYHTGEMFDTPVEQRAGQFFIKEGFAGYRSKQNKWGYATASAAKAVCLKAQG